MTHMTTVKTADRQCTADIDYLCVVRSSARWGGGRWGGGRWSSGLLLPLLLACIIIMCSCIEFRVRPRAVIVFFLDYGGGASD